MNGTRSAILTYHSLDDSGSVISVPPAQFRRHVEYLLDRGIPIVPLGEVCKRRGAVALTFDDGYRSVFTHALPVLARHGLPATVFVVTGHCGMRNDWDPPSRKVPWLDIMGWAELRELASAGVDLGGHGVQHRKLSLLSEEQVNNELAECRAELENQTGRPVNYFAYPYGVSTAAARRAASRHFQLACGTTLDFVKPPVDEFNLPRLDAFYLRRFFWFERVMAGDHWNYLGVRRRLRRLRGM